MLKYLYVKEVFREVPDEISLGISISGCTIHCNGCHSPELWDDAGEPLTEEVIKNLLEEYKGTTCLLLLGGEHDIPALNQLFKYVKDNYDIKTAWYCGLDKLPKKYDYLVENLDYIKTGSYKKKLGGLDSPATNQKLYQILKTKHSPYWHSITYKLQRNHAEQGTDGQ